MIYWYDYELPDNIYIQVLRQHIWEAVNNLFSDFPDESRELLDSYINHGLAPVKEIAHCDITYICNIIERHFSCDSFLHCRYVQDLARWCRRNEVQHLDLIKVAQNYTNSTYEMFIIIEWDRYRDKEIYEFDNYEEYERLKDVDIRSSFIFDTIKNVNLFYEKFIFIKQLSKNNYNYIRVLDIIIEENCNRNFHMGMYMLTMIMKEKNRICYIPRILFKNQLKDSERAKLIWGLIQQYHFDLRIQWILSWYEFVDVSIPNIDELLKSMDETEESFYLYFNGLDRYLPLKPDLFQRILEIITDKNSNNNSQIMVFRDLYKEHLSLLGGNIQLIKKSYLQQYIIQQHFDYGGLGFFEILKKDSKLLVEFIKEMYLRRNTRDISLITHSEFGFVWEIDGIEEEIIKVINVSIENELYYYGILDHICNIFLRIFLLNICQRQRTLL
ncbi:hypothetical protein [Paenibacillus oryzisoli]|uniref:Uncharacterized protein n=1 Tax=Paenibacillus oryzisoli TaxID=1850517 RepID=A0A198A2S3_9BACL|nr:hypothetical protein [Paenibacillus oryzisoli]OAS15407.1 hypothetical protein A8708_04445 [Paenibacillus oryzisoli]